ncbi:MAG: hypothetical protein JOZ64_12060 [Solirubrobacterales bacterium]|nr:hypothetical protein [Solirubrobacterales bacterium]
MLGYAAVLLSVLAVVLSYSGRAVLRSQAFADRATAALRDPAVQSDVADHVADAVVRANADLVSVRPLIRTVAGAVVGTPAFAAVFHRAVLEAHRAVVTQRRPAALVNVADTAVLIQGVLKLLAPSSAATVAAERAVNVFTFRPPTAIGDAVRVARALYTAAWIFALAAALLAVTALWVSSDRAVTGRRLGVGLALGGLAVVALYVVGGAIVQQTAPAGRGAAAAAIWRALAGGLRTQALWLAGAGAVVAGAASALTLAATSRAEGGSLRGLADRLVARLSSGVGRSVVAVSLGVAILLEPGPALTVGAVAGGLVLLAAGAAGVLARVVRATPPASRTVRDAERRARERVVRARAGGSPALRRGLPPAVAVIALTGAVAIVASGSGAETPAATPVTCNGYAALCGRTLDDVAFAATHNSFASVTIPTFLFGQQDGTIADQLRFGIRGFLIDTYYGFPTADRVRTDTTSLPKRNVAIEQLGAPAVQAAESIRSRLGATPNGPRGVYLCHGFCELGAVTFSSALDDLRTFLVENPGEVVLIINQDEGVKPVDISRAFEQAGLGDMIYRGQLGPFPTLGAMVQSGQRLVVMAENDAGEIPWYHLAYAEALQVTPFRFTTTAALTDPEQLANSCKPNRGLSSAPLFLLNNWVDTTPVPRPSNAQIVNGYAALLRRAETCERIRDRLPNLVAVDFYRQGDVLGVVRTLNGIAAR